jgi:hypothetical protein
MRWPGSKPWVMLCRASSSRGHCTNQQEFHHREVRPDPRDPIYGPRSRSAGRRRAALLRGDFPSLRRTASKTAGTFFGLPNIRQVTALTIRSGLVKVVILNSKRIAWSKCCDSVRYGTLRIFGDNPEELHLPFTEEELEKFNVKQRRLVFRWKIFLSKP